MSLPRGAALPMLFSALMGLCVLGADIYVLNGLLHQHADGNQIAYASVFALVVFVLWLWGFYRSWRFLNLYSREESAIPEVASKLTELAQDVEQHVKDGSRTAPKPLSADTPLLDRRIKQTWRALRRGAPLLSSDMADTEERCFPGPEREIRSYMDIALNVGIAGTFVSILVTLVQPQGLTADTLLAHIGPGMTSGLAAVIANVGLRLCHRAVQDEQDMLAARVEDTVADYFISSLPRSVTSPEDRLVSSNEQLAQDTQDILEYTLAKQNAATQKTLTEQAVLSEGLLKEHARLIGEILTRQIQLPIQQVAAHIAALAEQSGIWAATAADMKAAHTDFLGMHREAHVRHEAAMAALFAQFSESLTAFLEVARQANHVTMIEMQEASGRLIQDHATAAANHLVTFREQFVVMSAEQEAAHRRITDAALVSLGGAIDTNLATVEERIASTLSMIEDRLPDKLRDGVKDGLGETVALIVALREQAADLTHSVAQVSGNADRQLLAYERWQERANAVQTQLEQVVIAAQAAQSRLPQLNSPASAAAE